jgi:hypothetical protein
MKPHEKKNSGTKQERKRRGKQRAIKTKLKKKKRLRLDESWGRMG